MGGMRLREGDTSTTGTEPKDPRRQHAEEMAAKFHMSSQAIKDFTESLAGKFNARDESALGRTAVDAIRHVLDDPILGFLPTSTIALDDGATRLGVTVVTDTIKGSCKRGDRAHIYIDGARYESPWLAERWKLIGEEVLLSFDRFSYRTIRVFLPNGVLLGDVTVVGWWAKSEHTRAQRKELNTIFREKRAVQSEDNDPTALFLHCLGQSLLSSKRARKKVTREATALAEASYRGYGPECGRAETNPLVTSTAPHVADFGMDDDDEPLPAGVRAIN